MKIFSFIIIVNIVMNVFAQSIYEKLDKRIVASNSLVCVGLDPDITKLPTSILKINDNLEQKIYTFLKQIIDITAAHACSFKIQKAFYDQFDFGHNLLKNTVAYIYKNYPDTPVFIDCKIGDTDNTMKAYMHLLFNEIKADAVVINPYMGDDVLEPFVQDKNKAAIVLIQTSNRNAKVVQEIALANGKMLWEEILSLTINHWNINKNLIIVLSSNTEANNYETIRQIIPQDMPILLAGIGLQGGNPMVMKQLLNKDKRGVFVNSSRGILYPYEQSDEQWQNAVLNAVLTLKNMLNNLRAEA